MKTWTAPVAIALLFASCRHKAGHDTHSAPPKTDSAALFLALFTDTTAAGLHVYPLADTIGGHRYEGRQIDTSFYRFLRAGRTGFNMTGIDTMFHYFALNRMPWSKTWTALLLRIPSQYSESAIALGLWNKMTRRFDAVEVLADSFGDEGWYFVTDAWLEDLNGDGVPDIVRRTREHDEDLEDSTSVSESDSLAVHLFQKGRFSPARIAVDTARYRLHHYLPD
ncbi:MAG: hypothetical protein JWP27_2003 [Flaviaesturariibacter sp.]|nr:hypothetical protein [Flaviaesturariibacter sp.]